MIAPFFTIKESSISGIICSSPTCTVLHALIGMKKGIYEPHPICSIYTTLNHRSISPTMPFRNNTRSMGDMNPTTKFPILSFKIISIVFRNANTTSKGRLSARWRSWLWMQPKVWPVESHRRGKWTTLRYLGWISWLIVTSSHGWLKSTPIRAWTAAALCWIASSPTWLNNLSSYLLT